MTESEQRNAATQFYNNWHGKGDEKSDSQRFWIDFFTNVLGIENVTDKIVFEKRVNVDGQTKFIDVYIPETRVLIEQKSIDKDLNKEYEQSGGWKATPFQQGRRYSQFLPTNEVANWIVACNFKTFEIHDMNKPQEDPIIISLEEVRNKISLFDFMFKKEVKEISHEMEISVKAGEIVGILYDKLLAQYKDPTEESMKSLNALCVRLVFCLYAEDAGIFGSHMMFHDYLQDIPVHQFRKALVELFKVLDTKPENRDKYLAEDNPALAKFPYVNGGLFADENIEIPPFTEEIKDLLLRRASANFDWKDISPTIFGAVFESTLNPETRRSGGMHYTSIENIHKLIDPLFLDDLKKELAEIKKIAVLKTRKTKLTAFQEKLARLKFLDPACGSGNFLTETYISLRRLENEVLNQLQGGQMVWGEAINPIKVSIQQFYGIEINDFAVTVAKTALWIAESQMMKETEDIVHMTLDFLPLKSYVNIVEGNALHIDWSSVVQNYELNYIMGNPPFVGHKNVSEEQKADMKRIFNNKQGRLDYVSAWYMLAAQYIQNTPIECAFVSTNSIVQGTHIDTLWSILLDKYHIKINFAHTTFKWTSEAKSKANVFCVIVGFSLKDRKEKTLFEYVNLEDAEPRTVSSITPYLTDGDCVVVNSRSTPLADVPKMIYGNIPRDGGFYTFTTEEKDEFIKKEPGAEKYFYKFLGSKEYINNTVRWTLFLKNCPPSELRKMPLVMERVENVRKFRLSSKAKEIHKFAETPTLYAQQTQPLGKQFIIVPIVSSANRRYIPMGYVQGDTLVNNRVFVIPDADLTTFGILMSNVHNSWMRRVGVRLKNDYSYSKDIVYNTFPWPSMTDEQRQKIAQTAQGILDARALYPTSSFADLYDKLTMPPELLKAHALNDKAVMQAYGFPVKETTEESCVAELMKMYKELIK